MRLSFLQASAGWAIASLSTFTLGLSSNNNITVTLLALSTPSYSTLSLHNEDAKLRVSSCGGKLDDGPFQDFVIAAEFDRVGSGKIMVGPQTYLIHENPAVSGGIVCGVVYNDEEVLVTCQIPLPDRLVDSAKKDTRPTCATEKGDRGQTELEAHMEALMSPETEFTQHGQGGSIIATHLSTPNVTRDGRPRRSACITGAFTELVGDGNPGHFYLQKQLSGPVLCPSDIGCIVASDDGKAEWEANGHVNKWISGGFPVAHHLTKTQPYSCNGKRDQTICLWHSMAYTRYTVRNYNITCNKRYDGDVLEIRSPNKKNVGGGFFCATGADFCPRRWTRYWEESKYVAATLEVVPVH